MKKLQFTFIITPFIVFALATHKYQKTAPSTYSPIVINPIYPETTDKWTQQDKIDAFEYVNNTGDCTYKGIKLMGKVQFVSAFPDIKIQYVTAFPDIKVQFVNVFPDVCGKWQIVTAFADFKLQEVTAFPDLKVQKVTNFPGMK